MKIKSDIELLKTVSRYGTFLLIKVSSFPIPADVHYLGKLHLASPIEKPHFATPGLLPSDTHTRPDYQRAGVNLVRRTHAGNQNKDTVSQNKHSAVCMQRRPPWSLGICWYPALELCLPETLATAPSVSLAFHSDFAITITPPVLKPAGW